jgi:hypothetical protein
MARDLFIHVGVSKSGTSSLQSGLGHSVSALADADVGFALPRRAARVSVLLRPLGWEVVSGFPNPVDPDALDTAMVKLRRTPGDRLLLSIEDLAELDEERIGALCDRLERHTRLRPHVIVTTRDWSRQLPSEWQQQLKRRLTTDYGTWLAEVRDRVGEEDRIFRARQDVAAVCGRWAARVPPDRIHVVPVGVAGQDHDTIFRDFADIVGYDHALVSRPKRQVNSSYGLVECEVLRRLNLALGDRLSDVRTEYNPGVRRPLARGVLNRGSSKRVTLPPEHLPWVQEEMRRQVAQLRSLGVRERTDLDLLVPGEEAARPLPEISEDEIAAVAIETMAGFATSTFRRRRADAHQPSQPDADDTTVAVGP